MRSTPAVLRAKAAEARERAQQEVQAADEKATQLERKAEELERAEARRTASAEYRRQAKEAARTLAGLRAQRDQLRAQQDSIGQQQRELARARADADNKAAELRDETAQLMRAGADLELVAQRRSQFDSVTAVSADYDLSMQPLAGQIDQLQREIDGLNYPLERAEAERDRFEELAADPFGEEAQRNFEERRQLQLANAAANAVVRRRRSVEGARRQQRTRELLEQGMIARDDREPL